MKPNDVHDLADVMEDLLRVRNHAYYLAEAIMERGDDPLRHDARILLDRIAFADEALR